MVQSLLNDSLSTPLTNRLIQKNKRGEMIDESLNSSPSLTRYQVASTYEPRYCLMLKINFSFSRLPRVFFLSFLLKYISFSFSHERATCSSFCTFDSRVSIGFIFQESALEDFLFFATLIPFVNLNVKG